ncbi:MAG TPA: aspartyl protease family protein [Casimicrobiaceae bacterium]|jgi:predicted aspartyl protease
MKRFAQLIAFGLLAAVEQRASASDGAVAAQLTAASGIAALSRVRAASGGDAWGRIKGLRAEGEIETSRLPGTWSRDEDLSNGRWAVRADVRVFRTAEGFDGSMHWRQDVSGGVHPLNGAFSRRASVTEAWLTRRGWLRPDAGHARIERVSMQKENGRSFVVIDAAPQGGQRVQLWFDAATYALDRTVRTMPISTLTVRYSDYRFVSGVRLPFTIESRDSGTSDVETVHVTSWIPTDLASLAFAAPKAPDDTTLDGETTIPLETDGLITVEAKLNGRAFDFILDSGGHNIITPAIADALGVHPVGAGASGGAGAGELAQQYVRIDRVDIGAATLTDQHFYVIPLQYGTVERGRRAPLAGLLGLEMFERFAMRLDYPNKTLTLRRLAEYRHQGGGRAVPITFDDDMPLLEGRIDGVAGLIALDTGNATTTIVQSVWARKHGLAERLKRGIETVSYGAGGASRNWASRIATLEIGGTVLHRPIVRYAEDKAGAFSSRTEAANVGTDALANFVLDFDYANGVIWFTYEPGYAPLPFNRAGLRAIKEVPEAFHVALVLPGSPAAEAGIERDDRIVAIDGIQAAQMSGRELTHKLAQPAGTEIAFTLRRGNDDRKTRLRLIEMLP